MKNLIIISIFALLSISTSNAQKVKGSDTVLPLAQRLAENYPLAGVTITGGGSGTGLTSLLDNNCDIAMASRKIKFSEKSKLNKIGKKVEEITIAFDALAIIVNPTNKIKKLTKKEIERIFTGEITNWKQLGGDDLRIIPYARETSSGTYVFFKEELMDKKNYDPKVLSMPATGAVIQSVSQTKGAIGYVGLAYLNDDVAPVAISYDNAITYITPTYENAISRKYPVVRPLFFYYEPNKSKSVDEFIKYALSPSGQKIVSEVGYIPVK